MNLPMPTHVNKNIDVHKNKKKKLDKSSLNSLGDISQSQAIGYKISKENRKDRKINIFQNIKNIINRNKQQGY